MRFDDACTVTKSAFNRVRTDRDRQALQQFMAWLERREERRAPAPAAEATRAAAEEPVNDAAQGILSLRDRMLDDLRTETEAIKQLQRSGAESVFKLAAEALKNTFEAFRAGRDSVNITTRTAADERMERMVAIMNNHAGLLVDTAKRAHRDAESRSFERQELVFQALMRRHRGDGALVAEEESELLDACGITVVPPNETALDLFEVLEDDSPSAQRESPAFLGDGRRALARGRVRRGSRSRR